MKFVTFMFFIQNEILRFVVIKIENKAKLLYNIDKLNNLNYKIENEI